MAKETSKEATTNDLEADLSAGLSKPAQRALINAGYLRLDQISKLTEAEVLQLHGMGPKAIDTIRRALAAKGLSFGDG
ncbi:DNA-directed RNA polymerase alpha subunit [Paenibacillus castaneae]|nr:DNA-binding protein [Paenibacillus castaneae]NIK78978.1 DNA-directed RNA polymerase alpha subunit [Paenibacillus castaneae]